MQHVLDGFTYYDILLVKQDNRWKPSRRPLKLAHHESLLRQNSQVVPSQRLPLNYFEYPIVKDQTAVSDELFDSLRKFYNDQEIVAIVGFAAQMQATNNFNSVLRVDVDERLLPLKEKFHPVTWRENIK